MYQVKRPAALRAAGAPPGQRRPPAWLSGAQQINTWMPPTGAYPIMDLTAAYWDAVLGAARSGGLQEVGGQASGVGRTDQVLLGASTARCADLIALPWPASRTS